MFDNEKVKLVVNDTEWTGWEEVTVTRAIDEGVSSFSLSVSSKVTAKSDPTKIKPGMLAQVFYGKELLVTGYMDSVNVRNSRNTWSYTFTGRSKTKDLVDCSSEITGQMHNMTFKQIAEKLAEPFGVKVVGDASKVIEKFQLNTDGESPMEALHRIAHQEEYSISDTPEGHLLLNKIGGITTKNILKQTKEENTAILTTDFTVGEHERFNKVIVMGQYKGSDKEFGKKINQVKAEFVDTEIRSTRVKIIMADKTMTPHDAYKKAEWTSKGNTSKATELNYEVQGWTGSAGELWRENRLVNVTDEVCGINNKELIIAKVEYKISNSSGSVCTLTITTPDAFKPDPTDTDYDIKKTKGKAKKKSVVDMSNAIHPTGENI